MNEGWIEDNYLILFQEGHEQDHVTEGYQLQKYLPGHKIMAILGWDDFIVSNAEGEQFRVPTVPLKEKYLEKYNQEGKHAELKADARFAGKIKWYVKPLVFGGNPSEENTTWIDIKTHQELVIWWNAKYREVAGE